MDFTIPKVLAKDIVRMIYKAHQRKRHRKLIRNGNITIISNNCIGGFISQKYGMKYYSPIVGLRFTQEGFLKLCKNFEQYMQEELIESKDNTTVNFPVGKLGDLTIYFHHYDSFEEAKAKWDERKTRINKNRMFFIFVGNDTTPIEIFKEYDSLPLQHKLLLTNEKIIESKDTFEMHNGENLWIDDMDNLLGLRYYEQFNYYKWFMGG
jgi:uncharacterized protein (DUF1919 family)